MKKKEEQVKTPKVGLFKRLRSNITFNIICGILVLLILFSLISIAIGYWQFSDRFTEEYSENAMSIARVAESYVDTSAFDDYLADEPNIEKNAAYQLSDTLLQNLCDKVGTEFIYIIRPDTTDYKHITFIFNIVNKDSGFTPYRVGFVKDTTNEEYMEKYRKMYEGESDEEIVVRDKGYIESGSHITAMYALHDDSGQVTGILCVQRQMDALTSGRIKFTVRVLGSLVLVFLLAMLIYWYVLNRFLIRPIKRITKETARFAKNPSVCDVPLSQDIKSQHEIGVLARSIDTMESETLEYIGNLTRVTAERQRIGTELELASKIQMSMLNTAFPEHESFAIFASMNPAKEVGGDFYDFFMIDKDHLCISIADVSGKGVPAALFMTICKIVIHDVMMSCSSPGEALCIVNERICLNNQLDMFVTVWLGILELSTGRLIASNAGHEYPMIFREGKAFELLRDKHGFVVGGMPDMIYQDYELSLSEGDAIFVYTDGLPEAADADGAVFGIPRVIDALNREPFTAPDKLLPSVSAAVDTFIGSADQFDDLTMLCLKYLGPPSNG